MVSGASNARRLRDEADPGEDLIRLDHDLVGAVDPLYPRARSRNAASMLSATNRAVRTREIRRENQGQHRHLLSHPIVEDLWQPAHRRQARLRVQLAEAGCHASGRIGLYAEAPPLSQRGFGRDPASPERRNSDCS